MQELSGPRAHQNHMLSRPSALQRMFFVKRFTSIPRVPTVQTDIPVQVQAAVALRTLHEKPESVADLMISWQLSTQHRW